MEKLRFYLIEAFKEWRILLFSFPIIKGEFRILREMGMYFCVQWMLRRISKNIKKAALLRKQNMNDPFIAEYIPAYGRVVRTFFKKTPLEEIAASLKKKLSQVMETKQLYTNSELSIDDLSRELATNRTYLSRAIKHSYQLNFRDYLNRYRVEKAMGIMRNTHSEELNLLTVSENVGFQNYGTFHAAFKKEYGITPGEWKRRIARE